MRGARVIAIVGVAACYHAPTYSNCAIACTDDCPPGYTCHNNRCRLDGAEACTAAVDAAPGSESTMMIDAAPIDAAPNACPAGYGIIANSSTRYRLVSTPATFAVAAADCADDLTGGPFHTHLVVLANDLELSGVDAMMSGASGWIGLTDLKSEGTLLWVTAQATGYPPQAGSPWDPDPPANAAAVDCVRNRLAKLTIVSCDVSMIYYCECDMFANDPSRYTP